MSRPRPQPDPEPSGHRRLAKLGRNLAPAFARAGAWLRVWYLVPIAAVALAITGAAVARLHHQDRPIEVTIATGGSRGLRHRLLVSLKETPNTHGVSIRDAVIPELDDMIAKLESGEIQFAMIQGGLDLSRRKDLRQAAALNVEPLHLLVKEELFEPVSQSLRALRGKRVQLGNGPMTLAHLLGVEIMRFAGLKVPVGTTPGDFVVDPDVDLIRQKNRDLLPDAIFHVSALPSATARHLITEEGFRLIPLPFARAFILGGLSDLAEAAAVAGPYPLLKDRVTTTTIPAYTYRLDPSVPSADTPSLGVRIVLLTHRSVSPVTVERVLETLYENRFAHAFQPPLSPSTLEEAEEVPWHPGTVRFRDRDKPLLTGSLIGNLANSIQIVLPALGALLCVWQWSRQRLRSRRDHTFEAYILEVVRIESEALELELAPVLDLVAASRLRHELGRLKAEVLHLFCRGELSGNDLMSNFLIQINDTRSFLADLMKRHPVEGVEEAKGAVRQLEPGPIPKKGSRR